MRSIFIKLSIVCVGVFLALVILELALQIEYRFPTVIPNGARLLDIVRVDSQGVMSHVPSGSARHPSFDGGPEQIIRINSLGYRGAEPDLSVDLRIAVVGDSVVFNGGVSEDQTFESLLQSALSSSLNKNIQVLNYGVSGTNLREYVSRVRYHLPNARPDIVMVGLYLNDLIELPTNIDYGLGIQRRDWLHKLLLENILSLQLLTRSIHNIRITYLDSQRSEFRWVEKFNQQDYLRSNQAFQQLVESANLDWGSAWERQRWHQVANPLVDELVTLSQQNDFKLLFVLFPVTPQVLAPADFADIFLPQQLAAELLSNKGVEFLNLIPAMRALESSSLFQDQCHLTKQGNLVVAKALHEFVLEAWDRRA